jgi:hypothetical protein
VRRSRRVDCAGPAYDGSLVGRQRSAVRADQRAARGRAARIREEMAGKITPSPALPIGMILERYGKTAGGQLLSNGCYWCGALLGHFTCRGWAPGTHRPGTTTSARGAIGCRLVIGAVRIERCARAKRMVQSLGMRKCSRHSVAGEILIDYGGSPASAYHRLVRGWTVCCGLYHRPARWKCVRMHLSWQGGGWFGAARGWSRAITICNQRLGNGA